MPQEYEELIFHYVCESGGTGGILLCEYRHVLPSEPGRRVFSVSRSYVG